MRPALISRCALVICLSFSSIFCSPKRPEPKAPTADDARAGDTRVGAFVAVWSAGFVRGGFADLDFVTRRYSVVPLRRVTDVYVSGSDWQQSFKDYLAAQNLGSAQHGFSVPVASGSAQLPWVNLDRLSLRSDWDVRVAQGDLSVDGVNAGEYPVAAFAYDANETTATWTLTHPVGSERLTLTLDARSAARCWAFHFKSCLAT